MVRHVLRLPPPGEADEADLKSRTGCRQDARGRRAQSLLLQLARSRKETISGWGFPRFIVSPAGAIGGHLDGRSSADTQRKSGASSLSVANRISCATTVACRSSFTRPKASKSVIDCGAPAPGRPRSTGGEQARQADDHPTGGQLRCASANLPVSVALERIEAHSACQSAWVRRSLPRQPCRLLQPGREVSAKFGVCLAEHDAGLHQAELAAAVVARAVVAVGEYLFGVEQRGDAIGELNFATRRRAAAGESCQKPPASGRSARLPPGSRGRRSAGAFRPGR
jgi:hypothetical protein